MVGTVGMGGMWCLFATRRGGIWVGFEEASTSEPSGDGAAKARTGMGLGGRSF